MACWNRRLVLNEAYINIQKWIDNIDSDTEADTEAESDDIGSEDSGKLEFIFESKIPKRDRLWLAGYAIDKILPERVPNNFLLLLMIGSRRLVNWNQQRNFWDINIVQYQL